MSEHTAEPWICRIDETVTIRDSQDNQLGILTHLHTRTGGRRDADEVAANARRIVACVNACKDVDNETLEKIASGDMDGSEIFELSKVKQQRDMLLEAMNTFTPAIDRVLWIALNWNDHNFGHEVIRKKAREAASALGIPDSDSGMTPSKERKRLFNMWNEAIAAVEGWE